jgi:hypothetical protein
MAFNLAKNNLTSYGVIVVQAKEFVSNKYFLSTFCFLDTILQCIEVIEKLLFKSTNPSDITLNKEEIKQN